MRRTLDRDIFTKLTILSAIQFLRLSGVFFILPVLAIYASKFTSSGFLIGMAIAAYEISMAIMQIPSGRLSDRIGRINTIRIGLFIFFAGNLMSFFSVNIYELIISRFIAGLGAVSSPVTALSQEIVPPERKNTAMAIVGSGIGVAFLSGTAFSPLLGYAIHIRNIFLLSSIMAILGIAMISRFKEERKESFLEKMNISRNTLFISAGSFLFSIASFLVIYSIQIYAGVTFGILDYGIILLIPVVLSGIIALYVSEVYGRKRKINFLKSSSLSITAGIVITFAGIALKLPFPVISLFLIPFFVGFSLYEISTVPELTRAIRKQSYGSNIGFFYALQFMGNASGSLIGGLIGGSDITQNSAIILGICGFLVSLAGTLIFIYASTGGKPLQ